MSHPPLVRQQEVIDLILYTQDSLFAELQVFWSFFPPILFHVTAITNRFERKLLLLVYFQPAANHRVPPHTQAITKEGVCISL